VLEEQPSARILNIFCSACEEQVGVFNVATTSVTLFKWAIQTQSKSDTKAPTDLECLAATLIATVSRSGSTKSVIVPLEVSPGNKSLSPGVTNATPSTALHLWILNNNITYTSTNRTKASTAIKVLHKIIRTEEADKMIESFTSDVQDISFPDASIRAAIKALRDSTLLLPPTERVFNGWQVGLLDRWSPA
jgi:ubiquitin-protein ligase E3 D